jgi:hypothetical protein
MFSQAKFSRRRRVGGDRKKRKERGRELADFFFLPDGSGRRR